jgi:peptidoglycan/xylan/chitin deacetylase (PgdA/CDA1 family)
MQSHSLRTDLVTLAFHKIGEPSPGGWWSWFYIPEETFARQLATLRDLGCGVIDAGLLVRHLRGEEALPERPVLITFDDGYRSILTVALSRLQEMGYPAVQFVTTAYIGATNAFDDGVEPREEMCSWDELRALSQGGVSIQSHAVSHAAFSTLTRSDQEAELSSSKAILEDGLGKAVDLFAYPYGDCGSDVEDAGTLIRASGYAAAFLYGDNVPSSPHAVLRLPRIAMGPNTDLRSELAKRSWT